MGWEMNENKKGKRLSIKECIEILEFCSHHPSSGDVFPTLLLGLKQSREYLKVLLLIEKEEGNQCLNSSAQL